MVDDQQTLHAYFDFEMAVGNKNRSHSVLAERMQLGMLKRKQLLNP